MAKELNGSAANFYLVPANPPEAGPMVPMVECILIVSEPHYGFDGAGQMVKPRTTETIRLHTTPGGLRQLGKIFADWADRADTMAAAVTWDGPDEPAEPAVPTPEARP